MTMQPAAIREAVDRFVRARRELAALPGLPAACRPATPDDGYAVQEAFIAAWSDPVGGWKVGATAEGPQRLFGIAEPFYGPVFAPLITRSPAELAAGSFHSLALECEFAFRLGRDLPVRDTPYGRDELLAAIAALVPAIEVISPRLNSLTDYGAGAVIADCGVNGALILGDETADWQELVLDEQAVRLLIDGAQKAAGTGAAVLGHPLNALIWFVNQQNGRGLGLRAGEVVTTGTCTGLVPISAGQTATADFGALGQVSVRFKG